MKKHIIIIFILIFVMTNSVFTQASNNLNITELTISTVKNNVKATGLLPNATGLTNPVFQYKLNSQIETDYNSYLSAAASNKVKNLKINYEAINYNNILSIVIYYTNVITGHSDVKSYVINKVSNSYVTINSILGANGIKYSNKVIENKIKLDKNIKYTTSSPNITETQAFYVKDGNVVVVFGSGKIANTTKGVLRFEIPKNSITNLVISNYYTKSEYNVKMIPLRSTLEYFGYTINWSSSKNTISISKAGVSTTITVGRNSYYKLKNSPKQLEFAPEIKNGQTYVPISFFEEILGLIFAVDSIGNVTISQYVL